MTELWTVYMRILSFFIISLICVCLIRVQAAAWEGLDISGYVSQHTLYRVVDSDDPDDEDLMKVEEKLMIELEQSFNLAEFYVSGEAIYDPKAYRDWVEDDFSDRYSRTFYRLKEAYVDLGFENFDLRLGNQVVVWGKSDGMPITDVITPIDLSEFVIPEFEDQRLGIPAAKLSYYFGDFTFEGVVFPWFYESNIPDDGNWKMQPDYDEFEAATALGFYKEYGTFVGGIRIVEEKPDSGWDEVEFGIRLSGMVANSDVALIYFHGWEDTPSISGPTEVIGLGPSTPFIVSRIDYARMDMVGLNFTRPLSKFILRGEFAYLIDKRFNSRDTVTLNPSDDFLAWKAAIESATTMYEKDMLQLMIGADYSGITNVTLSLQFEEKFIMNFDSEDGLLRSSALAKTASDLNAQNALESLMKIVAIQASDEGRLKETEESITFTATGRFMQETLQPQLLLLYNFDYEDYYLKLSLGYNISDAIWVHVGYYRFEGDDTTVYGMFDDNDSVFFKLKYSFGF
ncbi:MAG: DUF1302 family protein [Deltaproteobacteria bacterium]|nr:DUF1302 family protein [Deltaproteobacteria bacterium]